MKFCYLDESGTGDEPYAVMVGIIADAYRMHITKKYWNNLLSALREIVGRDVTEIHTRDFYPGNSPFRDLNGQQRSDIIDAIFNWLGERRHRVVFSAVDTSKFRSEFFDESNAGDINSLWCFMGLHIALSIQKKHQSLPNNKGNTLLIFDNEDREHLRYTELIKNPPTWTDSYYRKPERVGRLNQLVDVPYFGDSKQVALIQLADFTAFFVRRYIELIDGNDSPRYSEEVEKVTNWFNMINERSIGNSTMYPRRGRCEAADLFYRYAPDCIRDPN